ncbi:MAG: ankyrin repeat domain-containing protein [Rhodospirillales bacterium]|nr:ankyrin repeat domain-containing protein [Rhodospirillales bacterium]
MTKCLIKGGNVNERLPGTGETVLHVAAATGARDALRLLIQIEGCDFLIRDNCGRLASEVAFVVGNDPAVARLLRIKERKQAKKQGVDLLRRT